MNSTVKFPAAHFRRRPSLPFLWAWVLLASVASLMGVGVARPHQDFPIAAEEHQYIFRSDGTYSFSYDTGGGEHQSFRIETRDATGRVSGRYGYIDPDGVLRITQYQADSTGYRANMLIYRRVTSPPPQPLLVGPLPRRVPDPDAAASPRSAPQPAAAGPIGPVPFFPPDQPVLIIGPLPKPLQPSRDDDDSFVPGEGFTLDTSQGVSLLSPVQNDQQPLQQLQQEQDSLSIKDVPVGPPPSSIPSSVLEKIIQDNFNRIFQGPLPNILPNPLPKVSQDISFNILQDESGRDVSRPTSSQEDLVRISQELLQGPEVIIDMASKSRRDSSPLPSGPLRVNRTRSNSTEERVPRTPPLNLMDIDATTTRRPSTTFDVFVKAVADSPSQNLTQGSQNYTVVPPLGKNTTTPILPIRLNRKDTSVSRPRMTSALAPLALSEVNREAVSKPDTQKASSVPVSINLPPVPPLTYLPADNTKVPMYSTFLGQLPDY